MFFEDEKTLGQWVAKLEARQRERKWLEFEVQQHHGPIVGIESLGNDTLRRMLEPPSKGGHA